jgi:hypothetical protein
MCRTKKSSVVNSIHSRQELFSYILAIVFLGVGTVHNCKGAFPGKEGGVLVLADLAPSTVESSLRNPWPANPARKIDPKSTSKSNLIQNEFVICEKKKCTKNSPNLDITYSISFVYERCINQKMLLWDKHSNLLTFFFVADNDRYFVPPYQWRII